MRKKILGIAAVLMFAGMTANALAGPITPGNLVVVQFGNGSVTLDGKANYVSLREFTTAGTPGQTLAMPTSTAGSNRRFMNSGNADSEGYLKLSTNGQYVTLGGYDVAPGTSGLANSAWSTTNRVVGRVGMDGAIDTSTVLNDAGINGNPRSAVMDGSNIWIGAGNSAGLRYTTFGAVGTSTQLSASLPRCREVSIFNGQLYASEQSSTTGIGIYAIGSGLPTTGSQTATLYVNTASGTNADPMDYWFADASTVYVADKRAPIDGGGIQKWKLSGSTWSLNYTLNNLQTTGFYGLTGTLVGDNAVLYATTGVTGPNKLVTVTDTGAASAFTTLFTAGANTTLRGVVLIPEPATLSLLVLATLVLRRRR